MVHSGSAHATPTSAVVEYTAPFPTFNGHQYTYVEGLLKGTITTTVARPDGSFMGTYEAPFVLIIPNNPVRTAWVEFPNTTWLRNYGAQVCDRGDQKETDPTCIIGNKLEDRMAITFIRLLAEDFFFKEGFIYAAITWDRGVSELFGNTPPEGRRRLAYGRIEWNQEDSWEIMKDMGRFLRNPSILQGATLPASPFVIASGYSQVGMILRHGLVKNRFIEANGSTIFDGYFVVGAAAGCWRPTDDAAGGYTSGPIRCQGPIPTADIKYMHIDEEALVQFPPGRAHLSRGNGTDPNYVKYELAGIAHVPGPTMPLDWQGATDQNPADSSPFFRAMIRSMRNWIENGTQPPPSKFLEGTPDMMNFFHISRDADGNALGGVRLPHMPSTNSNGEAVGAPTGAYYGANDDYYNPMGPLPTKDILIYMGGKYVRFNDDELNRRYPTEDAYQAAVTAAATQLLADGYILQEDFEAYQKVVPDLPEIPDDPIVDEKALDGGCTALTLNGAWGSSALLLGLAIVGLVARAPRSRRAARLAMMLLMGAALVWLAGCGTSDPACAGHGCNNPAIDLPEGGEIRLELVHQVYDHDEVRAYAWFASGQVPDARQWPRESPRNWGSKGGPALCTNISSGGFFPVGDPESRTYLDMGNEVKLSNAEGQLVYQKHTNLEDDVVENVHDILYDTETIDAGDLLLNAEYELEVEGVSHGLGENLFLPDNYEMTFPNMREEIAIPLHKDFPFIWDADASEDEFNFGFVSFGDFADPVWFCVGPNNGAMEIPQDVVDQLPRDGTVLHGIMNHRIVDLNGRRVDIIGINCQESVFHTTYRDR